MKFQSKVPDQGAYFQKKIKKGFYNLNFSQLQRGCKRSLGVKDKRKFLEENFYLKIFLTLK